MKKSIVAVLLIQTVILMSSCDNIMLREDHNKELEMMAIMEEHHMDSLKNEFMTTIDEIDKNLDQVRDQYGIIVLGPRSNADDGRVVKEQILNNITAINNLLAENKEKISRLEKDLKKFKNGKNELAQSLAFAKVRIEEQNKMMETMKEELLKKDFKIEELNQCIVIKSDSIKTVLAQKEAKRKKLEHKYVAIGTKKYLKNRNVIKPKSGLLSFSKSKQINPDLDTNAFLSINMYDNTELSVTGKNPQILSLHPAGSYTIEEIDEDMSKLKIKDPDSFWQSTNYLVVQVK